MNFDDLEDQANFSSFDPDFYDPAADNYSGQAPVSKIPQRVKGKAYFDLVFKNEGTGDVKTFELFNYLRSFTRMLKADAVTGTYGYQPLSTREGLEALINNVVPVGNRTPANESNTSAAGFVGFDNTGALIITPTGAFAAATVAKLSCNQYPYSGLLESSSRFPFRITRVRLTVTADAQISNPIVLFRNNFLGAKSQNEINPRNFFNPNQFQTKIIDVPIDFDINGNSGLLYNVNDGETVSWNVEIESYNLPK